MPGVGGVPSSEPPPELLLLLLPEVPPPPHAKNNRVAVSRTPSKSTDAKRCSANLRGDQEATTAIPSSGSHIAYKMSGELGSSDAVPPVV